MKERLAISLIVLFATALYIAASCAMPEAAAPSPAKWEYKVVYAQAANNSTTLGTTIKIDEVALAADGKEGWELITSYEEYNTVFPNFSADQKIVTGIESNVRPLQLVLLFKRPLK